MPPSTNLELPPAPDWVALEGPVEIADRIWWVGSHLEGDPFQCHAYLLEHGDQSVLFDPGSVLTFEMTRRKIEQVLPLTSIRYFVAHHQDPDITGILPLLQDVVTRDDAVVVTSWRAATLLRHLDLRWPFLLVDDAQWRLDLDGRELQFVSTPYLHFPGAFTTFDPTTGVLFSSDLFGAFTEEWELYARDAEAYFAAMRPFHEHYMPSREILAHSVRRLRTLPITTIAPQHGSVIPGPLVAPIMDRLELLECGLYLAADHHTDIHRLSRRNQLVRDTIDVVAAHRRFADIADALRARFTTLLGATDLELHLLDGEQCRRYTAADGYRGRGQGEPAPQLPTAGVQLVDADVGRWQLCVALRAGEDRPLRGWAILHVDDPDEAVDPDVTAGLREIAAPLAVAAERELLDRSLQDLNRELYDRSTRDPLTRLHNRQYLSEALPDLLGAAGGDRPTVWLLLLDLDHFKRVNDLHGHAAGDEVLRTVAATIASNVRNDDIAVRFGGEEFAVLVTTKDPAVPVRLAERLRGAVAAERQASVGRITVSVGVAAHRFGEAFDDLLVRADRALYHAKDGGRDRVEVAR